MKRHSLLFKFALIFLTFALVTLLFSGIATYFNQNRIYQDQQEQKLQNLATYLSAVITADGEDFPIYQAYFLKHYEEMRVPMDFVDAEDAREVFETLFVQRYPGMTLGRDIDFDDLDPEIQNAYAVYNHEYYLALFEEAAETFGLIYAYYVVPTDEPFHMYWMLDAVRENRGDGMIALGIDVYEAPKDHAKMWEAWDTGTAPDGYDVYNNEFGRTYAWYTPLYVDGVKLGLIGTEVEIADYNRAIALDTLRQFASLSLILLIALALTLLFIDRAYISRIRKLSAAVDTYASNKNVGIVREMEHAGRDELSHLGNRTADMILELDNYMKRLLETSEELTNTRKLVDIESQLARRDALTGVLNRNAYAEEVERLTWELTEGKARFGFVVVDVNYLKRINDTYGHEYGNITIQECSQGVCRVFQRSPVFRIGGDEFAVILENEDYNDVRQLVNAFNDVVKKNEGEPWKSFSAAIGYALYDPARDDCVANVFMRADKAMYRRKKEMKAERY